MIRIYDISEVVKFLEWGLPGARLREKGKLFNRYRVLVSQDKISRDMSIQLILLYCILKVVHIVNVMCFFHINKTTSQQLYSQQSLIGRRSEERFFQRRYIFNR